MQSRVICRVAKRDLLLTRPTVGALMALCEENYQRLARLAPGLGGRAGTLVSRVDGGVDLVMEIEAQSRYTTELRLTYLFDGKAPEVGVSRREGHPGADPDARVRAYHDARQVEVLDLRQTALPRYAHYAHPALDAKWRVNLFLSKWLAYCVDQGHRFDGTDTRGVDRHGDVLLPSCG